MKSSPEAGKSYRWAGAPSVSVLGKDVYLTYSVYETNRDFVQSLKSKIASTSTLGRFWTTRDVDLVGQAQDFSAAVLDELYLVGTYIRKSGANSDDPYKIFLTRSNDQGNSWSPEKEVHTAERYSSLATLHELIAHAYFLQPSSVQSITLSDSDTVALAYVAKESNNQPRNNTLNKSNRKSFN